MRIELGAERLAGTAAALREDRADLAVATRLGIDGSTVEAAALLRCAGDPCGALQVTRGHLRRADPPALLRAHAQVVLRDSARGAPRRP